MFRICFAEHENSIALRICNQKHFVLRQDNHRIQLFIKFLAYTYRIICIFLRTSFEHAFEVEFPLGKVKKHPHRNRNK